MYLHGIDNVILSESSCLRYREFVRKLLYKLARDKLSRLLLVNVAPPISGKEACLARKHVIEDWLFVGVCQEVMWCC